MKSWDLMSEVFASVLFSTSLGAFAFVEGMATFLFGDMFQPRLTGESSSTRASRSALFCFAWAMKCGGLLCSGTPVGPSRAALADWLSGLEVRCGGGREITIGVRVDKVF